MYGNSDLGKIMNGWELGSTRQQRFPPIDYILTHQHVFIAIIHFHHWVHDASQRFAIAAVHDFTEIVQVQLCCATRIQFWWSNHILEHSLYTCHRH